MSIETMMRELFVLASPTHPDRAALAALRRSTGSEDQRIQAAPYVLPHVAEAHRTESARDTYQAYFMVAGLFGIWANAPQTVSHMLNKHVESAEPASWKRRSVGSMMLALINQNEEAMERRFIRLLSARDEPFHEFLRQAFQLTRGAKVFIPVDFVRLFHDLRLWDGPSGESVRERWAQDFYPPKSVTTDVEKGAIS